MISALRALHFSVTAAIFLMAVLIWAMSLVPSLVASALVPLQEFLARKLQESRE